ncbi:hypothetical protein [Shouchella lehensis]|uniref:Uncharacterized protein n=1 Tax=Shouchella lehensis G1 TaxID=1246626 RepID=A0A060LY85_9BACI|nr:hypothetical protein [Shouchella lehensis]AIC94740.1 hypothetical protein BleG1_2162 [Shouchella lehensis G1]
MRNNQEKGIIIAGVMTILFMFSSLLSFDIDRDNREQGEDHHDQLESPEVLYDYEGYSFE